MNEVELAASYYKMQNSQLYFITPQNWLSVLSFLSMQTYSASIES